MAYQPQLHSESYGNADSITSYARTWLLAQSIDFTLSDFPDPKNLMEKNDNKAKVTLQKFKGRFNNNSLILRRSSPSLKKQIIVEVTLAEKLVSLKENLTKKILTPDELWMQNAESQFAMLQDLGKSLRPAKPRPQLELDKIIREPPDPETIDDISPIERHGSASPDMTIIAEQTESEVFMYESPPAKKIIVYEDETSPPKKPVMQKRDLPEQIKMAASKKLPKKAVKLLHNNLSKIDQDLEQRMSSFQDTLSEYAYAGGTGCNAFDQANADVVSVRSSKSSFYNYQKLSQNLIYINRTLEMSQRQNSPNVTQKGAIFVERCSQMSPQVRRGVHFFDENAEQCHQQPNSGFFKAGPQIVPRRQVGKMASGMSMGFQIDSDQAVYNSQVSPDSKQNSSFQSSQKLSPEERINLEQFYEREQYKQKNMKNIQKEVDPSYFQEKISNDKLQLRQFQSCYQSKAKTESELYDSPFDKKQVKTTKKPLTKVSKKIQKYEMSGLKFNIKDLYEDVESFHQSPQSFRQIIYNPNKILGSEKSLSSSPGPSCDSKMNIQLDGPASIKKALQQDFSTSPQPGNFTQREMDSDSPNKLSSFEPYGATSKFNQQLNLPLGRLKSNTQVGGFTIKLQNTDRGRDESVECYQNQEIDDSPRPSQSASNNNLSPKRVLFDTDFHGPKNQSPKVIEKIINKKIQNSKTKLLPQKKIQNVQIESNKNMAQIISGHSRAQIINSKPV